MIELIDHVLIGDGHLVVDPVIKTSALFLTATALFRFTEQRILAEFAKFDWIAAVADRRVMAPEGVPHTRMGARRCAQLMAAISEGIRRFAMLRAG